MSYSPAYTNLPSKLPQLRAAHVKPKRGRKRGELGEAYELAGKVRHADGDARPSYYTGGHGHVLGPTRHLIIDRERRSRTRAQKPYVLVKVVKFDENISDLTQNHLEQAVSVDGSN